MDATVNIRDLSEIVQSEPDLVHCLCSSDCEDFRVIWRRFKGVKARFYFPAQNGWRVLNMAKMAGADVAFMEELLDSWVLAWKPEHRIPDSGWIVLNPRLSDGSRNVDEWYSQLPLSEEIAPGVAPIEPGFPDPDMYVAPLAECDPCWEGPLKTKPWQYDCSVSLCHLNTPELLSACIGLLRLQTVRPYILLIDTGSSREVCEYLETLRAPDLEVHYIRAHGYLHSSEAVAVGMDLSFALCRTDYLYATHTDVFLRRRDYLEYLLGLCNEQCPVVGYEMSPRDWLTDDWKGCVSHTATMFWMPAMLRAGITWSMERGHHQFGFSRTRGGWPDTESTSGMLMKQAGIKPLLLGPETNYEKQTTKWWTHCRSYPGAKVLRNPHLEKATPWVIEELKEAEQRIAEWSVLE